MSGRPRPVGGAPAEQDRLRAVLAAGVARLSRLSLEPDAPTGMDGGQMGLKRRAFNKLPGTPPVSLLDLPDEIFRIVIAFVKGMTCDEIARQCRTSRAFAQLCSEDDFWRWQSQLRGYDRPEKLNPFRQGGPAPTGPISGSWKEHYRWWCTRVHTNKSLREQVDLLNRMYNNVGITEEYGHISKWDVSQVTDMSKLFAGQRGFNHDISRWDVSNVTNMRDMFNNCYSFNEDISRWNVSKVKDMRGMFNGARSFIVDLSGWDVSENTLISRMFQLTPLERSFNIDGEWQNSTPDWYQKRVPPAAP